MATWRYTARFQAETAGGDITRLHNWSLGSENEGLEGLQGFLEAQKRESGDRLRWVALERSESGAHYLSGEDWQEIKRLEP